MKLTHLLAAAAVLFAATSANAHDYTLGDLQIGHPYTFETLSTARAGGGYLTITNNGDTDDRLIAVNADFPRVMLHTTEMQDGVARMVHLDDSVAIPAGATVTLQPGEIHVMFMGLASPFVAGDEFPATLVFEEAGEVAITFKVEVRTADGHDHSAHADHADKEDGHHDH